VHHGAAKQELIVSLIIVSFDAEGVPARIVMIQDETARHLAEEKLRTSEERYRELFENANDVIFLHDLTGKIVAVNRAAEYLTGYPRMELLGKNFSNLVGPNTMSCRLFPNSACCVFWRSAHGLSIAAAIQ
jgi:PAS domain-containing protein